MKSSFRLSGRAFGFLFTAFVLLVLFAPSAQALHGIGWNIRITEVSSDTCRISWDDAPGPCNQESHTVQINDGGGWKTTANVVYFANSWTIDNLLPDTDYSVRVIHGATSGTQVFKTYHEWAGNFTPTVNGDEIELQWDAQTNATGYLIEYGRLGGTGITDQTVIASGSQTSWTLSNAMAGSTYSFKIRAALPAGEFAGWARTEAYTGYPAPGFFNAIPFETAIPMEFGLQWGEVFGAPGGYQIERSTWDDQSYGFLTNELWTITDYDDKGINPGTKYFYRIRTDGAAEGFSQWLEMSDWSSPPAAPTGLGTTAVTDSRVDLTWDAIQGINRYEVERASPPFTSWESLGIADANTFTDGLDDSVPVLAGNAYRYRVKGLTESFYIDDTDWSATLDVTTPSASPAPAAAALIGGATGQVTWQDVIGETGYEIERREASLTGSWSAWGALTTRGAGVTLYNNLGLLSGKRYQYRVRSTNGAGNSAWAVTNEIATNAGVPTGVHTLLGSADGANDCDDAIRVRWNVVPGATGYIVRRSLSNGTGEQDFVVAGGASTEFIDTGLAPFTVYWYRVQSTSGGGNSLFGEYIFKRSCPDISAVAGVSSGAWEVDLSWTDMTIQTVLPVSEYRIERRSPHTDWVEIASQPVASGETMTDTGVTGDGTYLYRMRGWWAAGGGSFSIYSTETTVTLGPSPALLAVRSCSDDEIRIEWDQAVSATSLAVYRRLHGTVPWTLLANPLPSLTLFIDSTVTNNTLYEYRLDVTNGNGTTPSNILSAVSKFNLTVNVLPNGDADVNWGPLNDPGAQLEGWNLLIDAGSGFALHDQFPAGTTSTVISGTLCHLDRVLVHATGSFGILFAVSTVETYSNPLGAPGLVASPTTTLSSTSVRLKWGVVSGASGYRAQRRLSGGEWETVIDTVFGVNTHDDTGLIPGSTYNYRFAGLDACGQPGGWSSISNGFTWSVLEQWRVDTWPGQFTARFGNGVYANDADEDGDGCLNIIEFVTDSDAADPHDCARPDIQVVPFTYPGPIVLDAMEVRIPVRADLGEVVADFQLSGNAVTFHPSADVPGATIFSEPGILGLRIATLNSIDGITDKKFARVSAHEP